MPDPIRIVIADDHAHFRASLCEVIEAELDLTIVAREDNGASALDSVRRLLPSVALLDIHMPSLSGIDVTRAILRERLTSAVVVLTMYNDESMLRVAFEAGAAGYLLKESAFTEVVDCIRAVAAGQRYVTPSLPPFQRFMAEG
jgi:DNA-binding NarL/FixJ family response regulator